MTHEYKFHVCGSSEIISLCMQYVLKLISQAHLARFWKPVKMASVIHVLATIRSYFHYDWLLQLRFHPITRNLSKSVRMM